MKPNLFESANLLLSRAREHRDELQRRGQAFFDENPYTTAIEFNAQFGCYIKKARLPAPLPPSLFPVAADAFNNLRHALDQAVCATALAKNYGDGITVTRPCLPSYAELIGEVVLRARTDASTSRRRKLPTTRCIG
ncbi:hypothetical protein [Methylocapsa sp. S129]|uniref:hypothetical protein n=1 Tax=Methylocapsa sp. S129 TaxID=1641869 RepID=UPI00131DA9A4|nr:hypothetical protein [Methylocapsa sp. S129]